jgi:hypothetical protein
MPFKNNKDGSRTWTNSSGTYSYTRDSHGHMTSRTTTSSSGSYSSTTNYSYNNGKTRATSSSTTYSNGRTVIRKK